MKKTLCFLTVLTLTLSLFSCSPNDAPMEYKIYSSSSLYATEISVATEADEYSIEVTYSGKLKLEEEFVCTEEKTNVEDAEKTKEIRLDGIEGNFEYSFSYATYCSGNNIKGISDFDRVDYYYNREYDDRPIYVVINPQTGKILEYRNFNANYNKGEFTQEQAVEKSKETLKTVFGEDVFENYTFESSHVFELGILTEIIVDYRCCVGGLRTTDQIRVGYALDGTLSFLYAPAFGAGDIIEENVTEEKIDAAMEVFKATYPNDPINDQLLILDAKTGTCFLRILSSDIYYINVTPLQDSSSE